MKFTANARELTRLINAVARLVSKDSSKVNVMNIEMVVTNDKLGVTALDGFRMIQKHINVQTDEGGSCMVLPCRLLRLIEKTPGDVKIERVEDDLHIETEHVKASIPVTPGEYIKHEPIWPDPNRRQILIAVNPKYMMETLKSLDNDGGGVILEVPVSNLTPIGMRTVDGSGDKAIVLPLRMMDLK